MFQEYTHTVLPLRCPPKATSIYRDSGDRNITMRHVYKVSNLLDHSKPLIHSPQV